MFIKRHLSKDGIMMKTNIFGLTENECTILMKELKEPSFRSKQLFQWLYEKKAINFMEMTNFSKALRDRLDEQFFIGHGQIIMVQEDDSDHTQKFLIEFLDGETIESVVMYYEHGISLCISTQVGCSIGCRFCASTISGKKRDLTAGEMLDQIFIIEKIIKAKITHLVLMGMGEPLLNYDNVLKFIDIANSGFGISQRRITLSTCGLISQIERLAEQKLQINLAISLHSALQDKREFLMPIAKNNKLNQLMRSCDNYFKKTGRRITYEYALIKDLNDRQEDMDGLITLLKERPHHLNLIDLNEIDESEFKQSKNSDLFYKKLKKQGINVTKRRKMGREIDAACGQLRKKQE